MPSSVARSMRINGHCVIVAMRATMGRFRGSTRGRAVMLRRVKAESGMAKSRYRWLGLRISCARRGVVNSLIGIHWLGSQMPRDAAKTRKRILDAAYAEFRRRGYSRVSMDEIASAARVTKRTLYYHFASKDALLTVVLEAQHRLALDAFRTFGDRLSGSAKAMIDGLFSELAVWADKPRWAGSGFTRLVIELADLPGH